MTGTIFQVNTFETWKADPRIVNSTDPAGIAYHAPSGHLFIADSEINENREFDDKNVFETSLDGAKSYGETWPGKDREPTGITWNQVDGYFYITNDSDRVIRRFDETLTKDKGYVSTSKYGIGDPEGITSDPAGMLYVVNGHTPSVAIFDNDFNFIRSFPTDDEMHDAEGIAYNEINGNLYLVSGEDHAIYEYTVDGQFVEVYSVRDLDPEPRTPQGLTFAPCTDDPRLHCLYIADGGVDNKPDGRIYEVRIGDVFVPNLSPEFETDRYTFGPIPENVAIGTVIGTVSATDPDGDPLTYQVTDGEGAERFRVNASGQIEVAAALDYESVAIYDLTLSVIDGRGGIDLASVTVTVKNTDERPVVMFNPIHDAHARPSNSNNYGDIDHLRARGGSSIYNSYLKFDVTSLAGPVKSAALRLFVVDASNDGGNLHFVSNDYADSTTPWEQSGLDGGNAPLIEGAALDAVATDVEVGQWVEFDVTSAISGSGIYSFGLSSESSNSVKYSSSEGSHPPQLVVETTPIAPPNSPPVANDQSFSTTVDRAVAVTLTGDDPDNDALTFFVQHGPRYGTLSGDAPHLTYTPDESFSGPDSFTFKVHDGLVDSQLATVSIVVSVDYPPVFTSDLFEFSVLENSGVPTAIGTVTAVDPEGDAPIYSIESGNEEGTFAIAQSSGVITAVTMLDYEFKSEYTVIVKAETPNSNLSSTAEVKISVEDASPQITSFEPMIGNVGETVVITGRGLTGTAVYFNGIPADFTIDSDTQISTTVPQGATTGSIRVATDEGEVVSAADFTVKTAPAISDFSPKSGSSGTVVTVTGQGFTDASIVSFNGLAAEFQVDSDAQLRATVPLGASDGLISITTDVGTTSTAQEFTVVANSPKNTFNPVQDVHVRPSNARNYGDEDHIRVRTGTSIYYSYLKFDVSGLGGPVERATLRLFVVDASGDGGTIYQVSNDYAGGTTPWEESGLTGANAPTIGGTPLDSVVADASGQWIEFDVTAAVTGEGIFSFGLESGSSNSVRYSSKEGLQPPQLVIEFASDTIPPSIDSFTPPSGPVGTEVVLTGSNFTDVTSISFNGTTAADFTVESESSLRVTVPIGASDGPILVSTPAGTAATGNTFDITHAPVAHAQSLSVAGNTELGITLTGSDTDGDPLTFVIETDPSNGTLAGAAPEITYTPNPSFAGIDSFTFYVSDGVTDSSIVTVEIAVARVNQPPVADDQSTATDEDTSVPITLTGNDPDDEPLTFQIEDGPADGTLSGTAPNLIYTPNENFYGLDSFRFKVNDGIEDSPLATVSISVSAVNDLPVADDLTHIMTADTVVPILLSGTDIDGDPLTYSVTSGPSDGSLEGTAPNLIYNPDAGFVGTDSFTYQVHDGSSASNTATVTINVMMSSEPVTISFQDEAFPSPAYRGTRDTKIRGDFPDQIYGSSRKLEIDGSPDIATLIRWDISAIPSGSFVQSASVTFNVMDTSEDEFEIYQALQAWSESEASYLERQAGVAWEIAGASGPTDRGTTVLGSVTSPELGVVTIDFNTAGRDVVQSWIDDPSSNWGFIFQDYLDSSTQDLEFASRENRDALLRPKLTIVYAGEPPATNDIAGFDIDLVFTDNRITAAQREIFMQAASRWSEVIIGDLPPLTNSSGTIDDLRIDVSLSNIDGAGGVLGNAGPTFVRSGTFLPARGVLRIDADDIETLEDSGRFLDLVTHEIGHVLGIGSIWRSLGLLSDFGGPDPRFTGAAATAEYNQMFGLNEDSVPVENSGANGTRDSHWRETVFGSELMTGYLGSGSIPLSRVTIASLKDLGYEVDLDAADDFTPISLNDVVSDPDAVTSDLSELHRSPTLLGDPPTDVTASWTNLDNAADVNGDGFVSPLDALQIINDLNSTGSRLLLTSKPASRPFLDVSGDSSVSPIDALMVVNMLNRAYAVAASEGLPHAVPAAGGADHSATNAIAQPARLDGHHESALATSIDVLHGGLRGANSQDKLSDQLVDRVWTEGVAFDSMFLD